MAIRPPSLASQLLQGTGYIRKIRLAGRPPSLASQLLQGFVLGMIFVYGGDSCGSRLRGDPTSQRLREHARVVHEIEYVDHFDPGGCRVTWIDHHIALQR